MIVAFKRIVPPSFVVSALVFGSRLAHADQACIAAYEQTQTLHKDGKLLASKVQAAACAKSECPVVLAKDCARWLAELEASIPSVVFEARSLAGQELVDVRVEMDGVALAERLDGKSMTLDPGTRVFRFEAEGMEPVERRVVVREGEKHRKIAVTMAAEQPDANVSRSRPVPLGTWIFGGASLLAFTTATVFAVDGLGKKSDLDACKPHCSSSDVDAMSSSFTVADVALGAGIMAGAAAVYLFFTRPEATRAPASAARERSSGTGLRAHTYENPRAQPFVVPLASGATVGVSARF